MQSRLIFVHALSPLHPGTGQGVGVIDLPIAREKSTDLPYLPGSSLKGVLRDAARMRFDPTVINKFFGKPAEGLDAGNSGAAVFSDQRLLLLPIRSLYGTFAWVTAPYVLLRFSREARDAGYTLPPVNHLGTTPDRCAITEKSALKYQGTVYLEDLDIPAVEVADAWADWLSDHIFAYDSDWQRMLKGRLCIVHDDVFSFLLATATEVTARIELETRVKTVKNLWYEEALPSETILAGLLATNLRSNDNPQEVADFVCDLVSDTLLQLGGKSTVGRGVCRVMIAK